MAETKKAPSASSVGGMDLYWLGAVVAIVLGTVCVLVFAPDSTIEKLFRLLEKLPAEVWGGIATAVVGTIVAIIRSRNGGGGPPAAGGAALALVGVLVLSGSLAGCGSAAETHARILSALDPVSEQYAVLVRDGRSHAMEVAATAAVAQGADESAAMAAAATAGASWEVAVAAQVAFDRAIRLYARALLANLQGLTLATGLQLLDDVLSVGATMADLVHGLDPSIPLPEIPTDLRSLLGGAP